MAGQSASYQCMPGGVIGKVDYLEICTEQCQDALPGVLGGSLPVDLGTRIVEEGVLSAGVDLNFELFAVLLQGGFERFAHRRATQLSCSA